MRHLIPYLYIAVATLSATHCYANDDQTKIKRLILNDCTAAQTAFQLLPQNTREELVPYLSRVLELQPHAIQSMRSPLSDSPLSLSLSVTEPKALDLTLPIDPNEGIDAKRCSLEILGAVGPIAFNSLPSIFKLAINPTIPDHLRRYAAFQARDITVIFAKAHTTLTEEQQKILDELTAYFNGNSAYIAQSVFIEIGQPAVPTIISYISHSTEKTNSYTTDLLLDLQQSGIAIAPNLYPLLNSSEEALQLNVIRLLTSLHPPQAEVIPHLLRLLDDISSTVRDAARAALKDLVVNDSTATVQLSDIDQDSLITTFRVALPKERTQIAEWLAVLAGSVPGLEGRLLKLYPSAPPDLKSHILLTISSMKAPSHQAYTLVQSALNESDPYIRSYAIRALGRFPSAEGSSLRLLARVFQTLPPMQDTSERELLQNAAAEAVITLHPRSATETIITPLIKMLEVRSPGEPTDEPFTFQMDRNPAAIKSRFSAHPAVRALVAIGEPARGLTEKTAKPGNSDKSRRAIAVLSQLPVQSSSISVLTSLLSSKNIATKSEATRALLTLGTPIVPILRKLSGSFSGEGALSVSEITILLGEKTLSDSKKLYKSLQTADCPNRVRRILLIGDFAENERNELTPTVMQCLGQNNMLDRFSIDALERLSPLQAVYINNLTELLKAQSTSAQLRIALLDHARELGIPSETIFPIFSQFLKESSDAIQVRLIRSIGHYGSINEQLLSQLKDLISHDENYRTRSYAAVAALAKTNSSSFDFEDWLKDELSHTPLEPLYKTLRAFPDDFAETLLLKVLPQVDDKRKITVLSLLSSSINPHNKIPEAVVQLLNTSDSAIKYQAFRVLSACCASAPINEDALNDILFSNENNRIAENHISPEIRALLEKISKDSSYRSQRATASRIVGKLSIN